MSNKHLVIALGGTGLKMARALRVFIAEEIKHEDIEDQSTGAKSKQYYTVGAGGARILHPGFDIRYLEVDSDATDLVGNFVGRNKSFDPELRLGSSDIFNIQTGGNQGANAFRSVGAKYFRDHVGAFDRRVRELVAALGGPDVNIHVCSGTAGGTGAGSVVDVVCHLRNLFRHPRNGGNGNAPQISPARISLYLQLPVKNPQYPLSEFYYANGYAVLRELSALNTRRWKPKDMSKQETPEFQFEADPDATVHPKVFDTAYLFDTGSEHCTTTLSSNCGAKTPMEDGVAQMAAQFIFQKIFVIPKLQNNFTTEFFKTDRSENQEQFRNEYAFNMSREVLTNGVKEPQLLEPYAEHARCFARVGLKRLCVPVEEIKTHFAAVLAKEVALQLMYNAAGDNGYADEYEQAAATGDRPNVLVTRAETRILRRKTHIGENKGSYYLSDHCLRYGRDMDQATEKWDAILKLADGRRNSPGKWAKRFQAAAQIFNDAYNNRYDTTDSNVKGVEKFFTLKSDEKTLDGRAGDHIAQIHRELVDRFIRDVDITERTIGFQQVLDTAKALCDYLANELPGHCKDNLDDVTGREATLEQSKNEIFKDAMGVGWFMDKIMNWDAAFNSFIEACRKYYICKTEVRAWKYVRDYIPRLREAANTWRSELEEVSTLLDKTLRGDEQGDDTVNVYEVLKKTCPADYNVDDALEKCAVVKLYDRSVIEQKTALLRTRTYRDVYVPLIRQRISEKLLSLITDANANEGITKEILKSFFTKDFATFLLQECRQLLDTNEMLGACLPDLNINEQIARKFQNQDDFAERLHSASWYLTGINNREKIREVPPNPSMESAAADCRIAQVFMYPDAAQERISTLTNSMSGHVNGNIRTLPGTSEAVVIRIQSTMPARILERVVDDMRTAYIECRDDDRAKQILHTQTSVMSAPDLFFPSYQDIGRLFGSGAPMDDAIYGNLRQLYLLGHVRTDRAGSNWIADDLSDVIGMQSNAKPIIVLGQKSPDEDVFMDVELRRIARETFAPDAAPDLRRWFALMLETRKEWGNLFARHLVGNKKQAQDAARQKAKDLLEEAWTDCVERYPDVTHPDYRQMSAVYNHYQRQFGKF